MRRDAFRRARDPPSSTLSFLHFFPTVPFPLFVVNAFQRDSANASKLVEFAVESRETRACTPIFRYRREKLVANTNHYLSRGIQAAAPLQLINFRAIRLLSGSLQFVLGITGSAKAIRTLRKKIC